jgi:transposase InsO family protein
MGIMNITMKDTDVCSITQLKELVKFGKQIEFESTNIEERYKWIATALGKFRYFDKRTTKKDRGIVLSYIVTMTGLSRSHIKSLVRRKKKVGKLVHITGTRNKFAKRYDTTDIARLLAVDNAHGRLSGKATKTILEREYHVYKKLEYEMISHISVSHIYNIRETKQYVSNSTTFTKTNPTQRRIGERRKPQPGGSPGYLRVDSVHQGDLNKEKGVYYVNIVDEVTQWELTGCVEGISEFFLTPLLEILLELYPFHIVNFHSDNGSEYINETVSRLLNKLRVEQTKSRSRHSNDNALVEGKNGAVIRKHMGYNHIPRKHATLINEFLRDHMNPYLNFHRPCGFSTDTVDKRGKIKKKYDVYMTPFEKLKTIPNVEKYLKDGVTIEKLEQFALRESDTECAEKMQKAKKKLFETIRIC